ncbi:TOK1 Outward-rectifier potassium channel TOK1 [Candida maltosa Xu316]
MSITFDPQAVKDAMRKARGKIVPDPRFQEKLADKGLEHYQDKLTPLLNNSYHGQNYHSINSNKRPLRSPIALKHALSIPVQSILNLNVRPGEPYFVLWFLISSYFPLISACLGPLANMVSIIALIEHWKVDKVTEKLVPDKRAVVVMNALSLALGIIGNISLLMNFSRSVKYLISQVTSILSWFFASALLAAALLVTHSDLTGVNSQYKASEGYYYAAFTAGFYFACMVILSINFIGYRLKKYPATFNLDQRQRTLMLFTIWFAVWTIIGALVMGTLIEGLSFGSSLYYCIVSFLTIGLGDILPQTSSAKVAVLIFSLVGVLVMGLIVATLRSVILSSAAPAIFWHNVEIARVELIEKLKKKNIHLTPEEAFHKMRVLRRKVRSRHNRNSLILTVAVFMLFWLVGALIFHQIEGWSYFNGMYFCFLCLITIGYGDFAPKTSLGRVFFVSWAVGAVPLMTILVSNVGDTLYDICNDISLWFSTWVFSTKDEYDKVKKLKKKLQEDQEDQLTLNSDLVMREEIHENHEIASLDQEEEEEEEDEEEENADDDSSTPKEEDLGDVFPGSGNVPGGLNSKLTLSTSDIDGLRTRIQKKKEAHETLLIFLEKLKPLINDSLETPKRKYSHRQWSQALKALNSDELPKSLPEDNYDGFWLGDNSPLRLPLIEPNYLVLRIYFKIEMMLRELVDMEIDDLKFLNIDDDTSGDSSYTQNGNRYQRNSGSIRFQK